MISASDPASASPTAGLSPARGGSTSTKSGRVDRLRRNCSTSSVIAWIFPDPALSPAQRLESREV